MATIRSEIRTKGENTPIYIRLTIGRGKQYRQKSGMQINSKDWSNAKKAPHQRNPFLKNTASRLESLKSFILDKLNGNNGPIDREWLSTVIAQFNGKTTLKDDFSLLYWTKKYIEYLPTKGGTKPTAKSTIQKYITISGKIEAYQNYLKREIMVLDVDLDFKESMVDYFRTVENLSANTSGRYIKLVKTICNYAKMHGVPTSPQLDGVKGFTEEAQKITFTEKELKAIENTTFSSEALDNARDWLLIGCYIGQRVGDVLSLTDGNIQTYQDTEMITLKQIKTGKLIFVPLQSELTAILKKRGGMFPKPLTAQRFNDHIKEVAKLSGIVEPTTGSKIIVTNGQSRKVKGIYPKCELVTSHIMRRTFATNHYGKIPTSYIIAITGHSTERQFLEYVGKPALDQAKEIAAYFAKMR